MKTNTELTYPIELALVWSEAPPKKSEFKPPLKWAGGKRWLVPHIEKMWQNHAYRRLVEPFCGGLGVALGLMPQQSLLNDVNPHLINFYTWLKSGLVTDLKPQDNNKDIFYTRRDRFNSLIRLHQANTEEAAILFYYLNRTGYNGLCRFNKKGGFNVPFGKYKTINYETNFESYKRAFEFWEFTAVDFEQVAVESDDFIYADPPYDVEFVNYSKGGFSWNDQIRLAEWLSKHKGPVIVSNQATPRIVDLYKKHGFVLSFLAGPRRISCNGDRTSAMEVLAWKGI